MKHFFAALIITLVAAHSAHCQEPKRVMRSFSMDDAMIIREIGAVIVPKNDGLVIDIVLGNHEKETSEIQKDDAVLMANGKKIKSIRDLREQYESAKIGDEFKLGLKRGESLQIARFVKKSEEELNKDGSKGGMVMRMERKEGEEVLPALGLMIGMKKNNVVVNGTLPTASNNFKTFEPNQGDVIVSINGKPVSKVEEFVEAYDRLKEGDNVTIIFSRDGKESKESFNKPKPMGRMMMKTK